MAVTQYKDKKFPDKHEAIQIQYIVAIMNLSYLMHF